MKQKKTIRYIAAAGTLLTAAGAALGVDFLHKMATARKAPLPKVLKLSEYEFFNGNEDYLRAVDEGIQWLKETLHEDVEITSFDGLKLEGHLYLAENAKRTIIMMHGFRSSWIRDFSLAGKEFFEVGCNLLIVEQRAHGNSDGKYITYGVFERYDCLYWALYAAERFGDLPLYLDGISMGAATVLMASALPLPDTVKGIIADCGYTSPKAIISKVFNDKSPVPSKGLVTAVSKYSKFAAGYDFDDYSTLDAMRENTRPIFFAHGDADDFVPMEMTLQNYEACTAPKTLFIAHGATHGLSYLAQHDAYYNELMNFFEKYDNA